MFLIGRTFSRQHPFPLLGKRPAIASMDPGVVPETKVETLFKECPAGSNNRIDYKLKDGEQGWYKIKTQAEGWPIGASGGKEYITYLCPGTKITMWNSYNGGLPVLDSATTAIWGGTPRLGGVKNGGAGAGSGNSSTDSLHGGAGFLAYLTPVQEPRYSAGVPVVVKTIQGYSSNLKIKYTHDSNLVTLTRSAADDGDNGYAWTGEVPQQGYEPLAVVGFTQSAVTSAGDTLVIYLSGDRVNPILTTTVGESIKTTYYIEGTNPDSILSGYPVLDTTGSEVGKASSVSVAYGLTSFLYNSVRYYYDKDAVASYANQVYYAWRIPVHHEDSQLKQQSTIIYTNFNSWAKVGENGRFIYEKVRGVMCIAGSFTPAEDVEYERVPELDVTGPRVAFGVTNAGGTQWTETNGYGMNGCYLRVLTGGSGLNVLISLSQSVELRGGAALGTPLKGTGDFYQGDDWAWKNGPAGAFGGTHGGAGAWCVVDGNDTVAIHGEGGGGITAGTSTTKLYRITDSTDTTKYAQRLYFLPHREDYTVTIEVNDTVVVDEMVLPATRKQVEYFVQDVKQGDVLKVTVSENGSELFSSTYGINTKTIAFGIIPVYSVLLTDAGDYTLTLPAGPYSFEMRGGGGAGGGGGDTSSASYPGGAGGAGGNGEYKQHILTLTEPTTVTIHVGAGGKVNALGGNGGTGVRPPGGGGNNGGAGGGGGEPTVVKIQNTTTSRVMVGLGGGGGGGGGGGAVVGRYADGGVGGGGGGEYIADSSGQIVSIPGANGGAAGHQTT